MNKVIKFNDFTSEYLSRKKEYQAALSRVLVSGWYILGKEVENFEKELADYLGMKYCIGVGNGLEAIQISLMALGIKSGDEVITTPLSAVATTLAILAVGAKPVFVDINERGQINAGLIESYITKKTKAILPVHLYGQPAEVDVIRSICKKHKIYLVEDAAQAHGATLKGKKLGTFGHISALSFYPTKNLGTFGDGGAIITNDKRLSTIHREIRDYGQKSKYVHSRYGLNSRLDELHAAILSVKLRHLDEDNEKRKRLAKRYVMNLSGLKNLDIILPERFEDSIFHLFVIRTPQRDRLKEHLASKGIPTLIHYPITIPDQQFLKKDYGRAKVPIARKFAKQILSLPIHPYLKISNIDRISSQVLGFLK